MTREAQCGVLRHCRCCAHDGAEWQALAGAWVAGPSAGAALTLMASLSPCTATMLCCTWPASCSCGSASTVCQRSSCPSWSSVIVLIVLHLVHSGVDVQHCVTEAVSEQHGTTILRAGLNVSAGHHGCAPLHSQYAQTWSSASRRDSTLVPWDMLIAPDGSSFSGVCVLTHILLLSLMQVTLWLALSLTASYSRCASKSDESPYAMSHVAIPCMGPTLHHPNLQVAGWRHLHHHGLPHPHILQMRHARDAGLKWLVHHALMVLSDALQVVARCAISTTMGGCFGGTVGIIVQLIYTKICHRPCRLVS